MNRRNLFGWIAALFAGGVARGQENTAQAVPNDFVVSVGPTTSKLTYGAPNQCPVCGTLAEPYVRGTVPCPKFMTKAFPGIHDCIPFGSEDKRPMERITRCSRCSAAFWQTAKE